MSKKSHESIEGMLDIAYCGLLFPRNVRPPVTKSKRHRCLCLPGLEDGKVSLVKSHKKRVSLETPSIQITPSLHHPFGPRFFSI